MENINKNQAQNTTQSASPHNQQRGLSSAYQAYDSSRDTTNHISSRNWTHEIHTSNKQQEWWDASHDSLYSQQNIININKKEEQLESSWQKDAHSTIQETTPWTIPEQPTEKDLENALYEEHIIQSSHSRLRRIYGILLSLFVTWGGYFFLHTLYPVEVEYWIEKASSIFVGEAYARDPQDWLLLTQALQAAYDSQNTPEGGIAVMYDDTSWQYQSSAQNNATSIPTSLPDTHNNQTIPQQMEKLYWILLSYADVAESEKQKKLVAHWIKQYNDISWSTDLATLSAGVQSLQELIDKIAPLF